MDTLATINFPEKGYILISQLTLYWKHMIPLLALRIYQRKTLWIDPHHVFRTDLSVTRHASLYNDFLLKESRMSRTAHGDLIRVHPLFAHIILFALIAHPNPLANRVKNESFVLAEEPSIYCPNLSRTARKIFTKEV